MGTPDRIRALVRSLVVVSIFSGSQFLPAQEPGGKSGENAKPRLRFVMVSDTHVQAPSPVLPESLATYPGANGRFTTFMNAINQAAPDFVIGIGDLVHGEQLDRLAPDLQCFQDLLKTLRCPFYPVVGNHEVVQREGDPAHERPYREAFGDNRVNYTVEQAGILFIMINDSGAMCVKEDVTYARNLWLKKTLEASPGMPKILCCHIPLVPVREESVLKRSFGFPSYIAHDREFLDLLRDHKETIIAMLNGHLHLTGVTRDEGIYHIVSSGTASYPHDYVSFEIYPDRIHVRMTSLPETEINRETNIHGRPRYKTDFVDKDHETHELYLRGNKGEREFDIELSGKKRPAAKPEEKK
jgi:hypothetical protein